MQNVEHETINRPSDRPQIINIQINESPQIAIIKIIKSNL